MYCSKYDMQDFSFPRGRILAFGPLSFLCSVLQIVLCLSSLWSLYVLWITVSDYLFDIFNCVLLQTPSVCLNIIRTLCVQYVHVYVCIQWSRTVKQCWFSVNRLGVFYVNIVNGVIFSITKHEQYYFDIYVHTFNISSIYGL